MNRVLAVCLVLALAAGSGISRYKKAGERARIEDVRRSLAVHAAQVDQSIRSGVPGGLQQIDTVLKDSKHHIAWVHVRDASGAVRAHAGDRAVAVFPLEFVHSQLRSRRPVFAVTQTEDGPVLLEAFAVRLPARSREVRFLTVSQEAEQYGVIEIAAHIDGLIAAPAQDRRWGSVGSRLNSNLLHAVQPIMQHSLI